MSRKPFSRKSFVSFTFQLQCLLIFMISAMFWSMFTAPSNGWGAMLVIIPMVFIISIIHLVLSVCGLFAKNYIFILPRLLLILIISIVLLYLKFFSGNLKIDYFNYFFISYIPICLIFCLIDFLELSDLKKRLPPNKNKI